MLELLTLQPFWNVQQTPCFSMLRQNIPVIVMASHNNYFPAYYGHPHSQIQLNYFSSSLEKEISFVKMLATNTNEEFFNSISQSHGVLIDGRYQVLQHIGSGAFGNVFETRDAISQESCAMKVIKKQHSKAMDVQREIDVLTYLNRLGDATNRSGLIVRLFGAFKFHEHIFIIYELLGENLESVLRYNKRGFSLQTATKLATQIIYAINFLHAQQLVHHDIKTENIVFVNSAFHLDKSGVKVLHDLFIRLVDFGSTLHVRDNKNHNVATTRQFRSPEMDCYCTWGLFSDIWSVGCTLFEIISAKMIFPCENETEKFFMIESILEQSIPHYMGKSSKLNCFSARGNLKYDASTLKYQMTKFKTLKEMMGATKNEDLRQFLHLISQMLQVQPSNRILSDKIFGHPFWHL